MSMPDEALKAIHELGLPTDVKLDQTTELIQMTHTHKEGILTLLSLAASEPWKPPTAR
jgi:hypothetical protein